MTAAGWIIMIVSITAVLGLTGFCLRKVIALPPLEVSEHLKAPLDIDTRDTNDAD
jgi:hypothetical protein